MEKRLRADVKNGSGIQPTRDRVLVLPDQVSSTTAGGLIVKTEQTIFEETFSQVYGTLVAHGSTAFDDLPEHERPNIGDKVWFSKFSGIFTDKFEGMHYRLVRDEDVHATMFEVTP